MCVLVYVCIRMARNCYDFQYIYKCSILRPYTFFCMYRIICMGLHNNQSDDSVRPMNNNIFGRCVLT